MLRRAGRQRLVNPAGPRRHPAFAIDGWSPAGKLARAAQAEAQSLIHLRIPPMRYEANCLMTGARCLNTASALAVVAAGCPSTYIANSWAKASLKPRSPI